MKNLWFFSITKKAKREKAIVDIAERYHSAKKKPDVVAFDGWIDSDVIERLIALGVPAQPMRMMRADE